MVIFLDERMIMCAILLRMVFEFWLAAGWKMIIMYVFEMMRSVYFKMVDHKALQSTGVGN